VGKHREYENMPTHGEMVLQNVRRYRAIAALYRQTATFRPIQGWSLLEQAKQWEHRAVAELEAYFNDCDQPAYKLDPEINAEGQWEMMAA
jgi:hypothetical protein